MSDFDINFTPWINYGRGDEENKIGEKMDELLNQSWSPFNGCTAAQVFVFCMSYAVAKGRNLVKPPGSKGSMPASAFNADMRDLMKAVAIVHAKELEIITKPKEVVRIAEGYSYASFNEVYEKIVKINSKNYGDKTKKSNAISGSDILDLILQEVTSKNSI